jgi:peptidoglycan-associated lipoprotein
VVGPEGPVSADQFLKRVYFDFDKSSIRPDQVEAVTQNAAWLKAHPDTKVLIEGHCDERGTTEYNFALGARRADTVQQFLVEHGANAANVTVISKGEEEPADPGHDEAAWAKNRRAQFMFLSKPPAE